MFTHFASENIYFKTNSDCLSVVVCQHNRQNESEFVNSLNCRRWQCSVKTLMWCDDDDVTKVMKTTEKQRRKNKTPSKVKKKILRKIWFVLYYWRGMHLMRVVTTQFIAMRDARKVMRLNEYVWPFWLSWHVKLKNCLLIITINSICLSHHTNCWCIYAGHHVAHTTNTHQANRNWNEPQINWERRNDRNWNSERQTGISLTRVCVERVETKRTNDDRGQMGNLKLFTFSNKNISARDAHFVCGKPSGYGG